MVEKTVRVDRSQDADHILFLVNKSYWFRVQRSHVEEWLSRKDTIFVVGDHGGFLCRRDGADWWITFFLTPKGKGEWGKAMAHAAVDWLFRNTDCERVMGYAARPAALAIRNAYAPPGALVEHTEDETAKSYMRWIYERNHWKG